MKKGQAIKKVASFVCLFTFTAQLFLPQQAQGNPTGGQVTSGTAGISHKSDITTINQNSGQAIIDWRSFIMSADELTRFIQPSSGSVILNRVDGGGASGILGQLQANGNIFALNPNGFFFGAGSQVNAAGIFAGTLSMSNQDFLNGNYRLTRNSGRVLGAVINDGDITAGSAALAAPLVYNKGVIVADSGNITLAGTEQAVISFERRSLINFAGTPTSSSSLPGVPSAPSGSTHSELDNLLLNLVNNKSVVPAGAVTKNSDGSVSFGGVSGVVINSGALSVDGISTRTNL